MAYKISNPKVKEKEYTSGELFGAGVPSDIKDSFKEPKEEKEAEEGNNFKIEDTKKALESNSDSFQVNKQEEIAEIQQDLFSENIPIEIQDETTLIVKAGGETHKITRKDLAEYQRRYGETEEGSGSGFRQFGSISGDWRPISTIASDVSFVFNKLDEKSGTYRTSISEE